MRIAVMGTGGTGGYFGAKLARAGEEVVFVARGAHLEALQRDGLRVRSAIEGEWAVKVDATERLEGRPPADVVLFCVKSFDTETAADVIRPVVGPDTAVLPIQNGVSNEEILAARLGASHVMGGVAQVFATIAGPGLIAHTLLGRILFGEMDGRSTPRARAFLEACGRAAIPAELVPDVVTALWDKYVFIVANAGMTALTRLPVGVIRRVPETRAMLRRLLEEMVRLGRAAGAPLQDASVDARMAMIDGMGGGAYSSLHHDLTHGKRLELEALHGHAVRLGERLGVPTPMVFAVYAALRPHAAGSRD
jgi:2-dehydropantoate 2-reductase